MSSRRAFALAGLLALVSLLALLQPSGPAQAQEPEEQYVDLGVEIVLLSDKARADTRVHLRVSNTGNRTAYDVNVGFDKRTRSQVGTGKFTLREDLPVGTANIRKNESMTFDTQASIGTNPAFQWQIPEIPAHTAYTAHLGGTSQSTDTEAVEEYFATVSSGSHESPDRQENNSHRAWGVFSQRDSGRRSSPAEPDYSVDVSVTGPTSSGATFAVSVVLPKVRGIGSVIGHGCVNVRLTPGLNAGSPTFTKIIVDNINSTPVSATGRSFDTSASRECGGSSDATGVYKLPGTHGDRKAIMTLPVTVNSGATLSEQCLTAELFANPPAGGGRYHDDPNDNVVKVCPWGGATTIPLRTGAVSVWTHYPCVGITTAPCDSGNDVRVRATVPDQNGVILDSGTAVFHIPDAPLTRAYDAHSNSVNNATTVSWQTSCDASNASCTGFTPDREEFGVKLHWNANPFDGLFGGGNPWAGITSHGTVRGQDQGTNPPGKMRVDLFAFGLNLFQLSGPNWSSIFPTGGSTFTSSATTHSLAEFEKLGTYVFDYTLRAKHSTLTTGDCATGIAAFDNDANSFCATETYIFHVGPMADLEVRDGGASDRVAAGRKALTIVAVNNGPDNAPGARVTGLPTGAEVISVSQGSYDAGTGVWNIGKMRLKDYYQSRGEPYPTLILGASADADVTIENTVDYTVCIGSDRATLAHTTESTCIADTANGGSWHVGKYDPRVSNDSLTIKARTGSGGGGVGAPTLGDLSVHAPVAGLTWSEVKTVNTLPVTSYQVQWSRDGVNGWRDLKDSLKLRQMIDIDIESDLTRYYRVRAVNGAGFAGPWSLPRAVNDRVERPVSGLRAEPGYGEVELLWGKVEGATGYEVRTGGGDWIPVGDVNSYWVTGLASTPHVFRVRPVTATGYGPVMETSATPLPAEPEDLEATRGDGRVSLSWSVVAGATGYEVKQDAGVWQNIGSVSAHTATGLENGREYTFHVRAVNGALKGKISEAVTATPQEDAGPPPLEPNAPTWLDARPGYGEYGGQVTLTWDAVPNAEGYECESKEDGDVEWWYEFPHCPTTNTSVTLFAYPQTAYEFRVRAWRTIDDVRYYSTWKQTSISSSDWPNPNQGGG